MTWPGSAWQWCHFGVQATSSCGMDAPTAPTIAPSTVTTVPATAWRGNCVPAAGPRFSTPASALGRSGQPAACTRGTLRCVPESSHGPPGVASHPLVPPTSPPVSLQEEQVGGEGEACVIVLSCSHTSAQLPSALASLGKHIFHSCHETHLKN